MVGNGRAEGSSAIGDRGQATNSPTPDVDGTDSGSLLDSILSTPVKKRSSDVWFVALFFFFFLLIDDMVVLDCILNSCRNLPVPFSIQVPCFKT